MIADILAGIAWVALALSNVYSTSKVLRPSQKEASDEHEEIRLRRELEYWGVFTLAFVAATFSESAYLRLLVSAACVLAKHLDREHTLLSSAYRLSNRAVHFADEHFITDGVQKYFIRPGSSLVLYALETTVNHLTKQSKNQPDRTRVADAIKASNQVIVKELNKRLASTPTGWESTAEAEPRKNFKPAAEASVPRTPKRPAKLSFASLRRYFGQNGVSMSDEQVAKILKNYEGRDTELRQKLAAKYSREVDEVPAATMSTPMSADGHIGRKDMGTPEIDIPDEPATDGMTLRRRTMPVR